MTETIQPKIDRALTRIDRECELLEAERDAFRALLRRISGIQMDLPGSTDVGTGGAAAVATSFGHRQSGSLHEIREAYRETVMAVPHYDTEYDESLEENLTAECGHSLANRIVDGEGLPPTVYEGFLGACKRAHRERERTLQYVKRERDSVGRYGSKLDDIESAVVEAGERIPSASDTRTLSRIDGTLAGLESRCSDLAEERQEQIHERSATDVDGSELGFLAYLYADLETTTPVLADVASCLETIRHYRGRCLR